MKILGIETSCDETAAAVVEDGTKVLSSVVASSAELQAKYGGVVPEQAAREQVRAIVPVIKEAVEKSQIPSTKFQNQNSNRLTLFKEIDAIAVTVGPGLIGSLLIGVETAKTLAFITGKPIIPVNHLVGHVYGCWLTEPTNLQLSTNNKQQEKCLPELPALVLLVSGGHTELVLMKNHGDFHWISGTRDDAAGECFDKCARILGLPYPGGPAISAAAEKLDVRSSELEVRLPRPLMDSKDFDFSFSGLKTAVLNNVNNIGLSPSSVIPAKAGIYSNGSPIRSGMTDEEIRNMLAFEVQEAITDVLVKKTIDAALELEVESILVVGGVAANKVLREKITNAGETNGLKVHIPPFKFCTDNAAYIASAAFFNYHEKSWQEINADSGLTIGV